MHTMFVFRRRNKRGGDGLAAMTGSAGHMGLIGFRIRNGDLGQIGFVDLVRHPHHGARDLLFGLGIGGEVRMVRLHVDDMAEAAFDSEGTGESMHDLHQVVGGNIFGKHLQIRRLGHWPVVIVHGGRRRGLLRRLCAERRREENQSCGENSGEVELLLHAIPS